MCFLHRLVHREQPKATTLFNSPSSAILTSTPSSSGLAPAPASLSFPYLLRRRIPSSIANTANTGNIANGQAKNGSEVACSRTKYLRPEHSYESPPYTPTPAEGELTLRYTPPPTRSANPMNPASSTNSTPIPPGHGEGEGGETGPPVYVPEHYSRRLIRTALETLRSRSDSGHSDRFATPSTRSQSPRHSRLRDHSRHSGGRQAEQLEPGPRRGNSLSSVSTVWSLSSESSGLDSDSSDSTRTRPMTTMTTMTTITTITTMTKEGEEVEGEEGERKSRERKERQSEVRKRKSRERKSKERKSRERKERQSKVNGKEEVRAKGWGARVI